jgi:hypothetical protein
MKAFITGLLFVLGLATNLYSQYSPSGKFWIPANLHWQCIPGAPKEVQTRTAQATVLYFRNDGKFVRDDCWLIKQGDSITVDNGDPHDEYVGQTAPILDGMHLTYRLVRRTVERSGENLPGNTISEDASTLAVSGLSIGKHFFRPVQLTNASEYEATYEALLTEKF